MKGMRVTQISKDIWFKGVWGELEPGGGGFRGQPVTGYLGLALVFVWGSALWEEFGFCF